MKTFRLIALLGVMMCLTLAPVQANILVTFVSTTSCGAGCFTWTYNATMSAGEETSETDNGGPFNTFFTLYDIAGLLGGITNPATDPTHWSNSTQTVGITPAGIAPTDNPTVPNITWTYIPTSQVTGNVDLGNFSFNSSLGTSSVFISYTQQDTKDNPGHTDDDVRVAGLSQVIGPTTSSIPEPTSVLLLGTLLSLVGFGLRKRSA
jgi:hypothetical protein